jgi:hypothetical protein
MMIPSIFSLRWMLLVATLAQSCHSYTIVPKCHVISHPFRRTSISIQRTNCWKEQKRMFSLSHSSTCLHFDDDDDDAPTFPANGLAMNNNRRFLTTAAALIVFISSALLSPVPAVAAPPFAVIAEELGYFPVMVQPPGSSTSMVQYVPKRVQRTSTQQAIDLAHYIRTSQEKVVLAGTYWCSHTSRQKELFGAEAWNELNASVNSQPPASMRNGKGFMYVECAPQGYHGNPTICSNLGVDGYPTWIITPTATTVISSKSPTIRLSGEHSLAEIAEAVGYNNDNFGRKFDAAIEDANNPPTAIGSSACKN